LISRETKVQDLDDAVGRDLDIGRLQIAMDDPFFMRRIERVGNFPREGQRFSQRQSGTGTPQSRRLIPEPRARRKPFSQRLALHELQHERWDAATLFHAVDRADVGMIERGQHASLAVEPSSTVWVSQKYFGQDLDRDVASEPCVAGAIDLAHASGPEERDDFIRADVAACPHGHLNTFVGASVLEIDVTEACYTRRPLRAPRG